MRKIASLLSMLSLVILASIAPAYAQETDTLTGTKWQLVSMAGDSVGEMVITLEFNNDERAGGQGGCNTYSATYTLDGTKITFNPIISTLMACEPELMEWELVYFAALEAAVSYEISDRELVITYGDGEELVYEPLTALAGSTWQLLTYNDRDVLTDSLITLEFGEDGQISGSGGCNSYGGMYTLDGDRITIERIRSTRMACADEAATRQEQDFFTALQTATTLTIEGDQLTLTGEDDAVLVFNRVQPLVNTAWQLVSIAGTEVATGSGVTLEFDNVNRIAGSGGCNGYSGEYSIDEDALTLSEIVSTKRACTDSAMMQQEIDFFNALEAATSYELSENQLIITYGDGEELVFVSTTPVARA